MSTTVHLKWDGPKAEDALARVKQAVIEEAAASIEAGAKRQAVSMIYQQPESPTYKRTGNLLNSIAHDVTQGEGVVWAGAEYAPYVHEGTRHVAARPFLREAFDRFVRILPIRVAAIARREGL